MMDFPAIVWPSELEEMEEEARLIHESEWQLEMMRPFEFPPRAPSSCDSRAIGGTRSKVISFGGFQKVEEEALSDPVDLIRLAPAMPASYRSGGAGTENVVAERRRREKLNQGFIQLSSLLPNLKKLDKASVLAEAASYLKQLQVRVTSLEEHRSVTKSRTHVSSIEDRDTSSSLSSDENFVINNSSGDRLLEVEARIADKDVLIMVHCQRNRENFPRVLEDVQKLNLDIINCNTMDFGKHSVIITILARMNREFSTTTTTTKNLVGMLQQSLRAHL